jgi:hypothetical protein
LSSGRGNLEVDAAVVVLLGRGGQIEVRECNFLAMSAGQIVKHISDNCVVRNFELMAVFEYEHSLRLIGSGLFGLRV